MINRIQKVLEGANIKLSCVASDIVGVSGRNMLKAIAKGTADPVALAQPSRGRLRSKVSALEEAMEGLVGGASAGSTKQPASTLGVRGTRGRPIGPRRGDSHGPL